MTSRAEVVVCGAGIAGIATAYQLAVVRRAFGRVVLIDEREPMTLTTDKGTQGYRNWWPGPDDAMLRLVSRSIDILEELAVESGNAFRLNRRGYLFATARDDELARLRETAARVSEFGMGPVRVHSSLDDYRPAPAEGFTDQPTGADILVGDAARRAFPYLADDLAGVVHVRRAGWVQSVAMGGWMLKRALDAGVTFVHDRVTGIDTTGGRVNAVSLAGGERIETNRVVVAAGPVLPDFARMLGVELPVFHELHAKMLFRDPLGVVPRSAPFVIWSDPERLPWTAAEHGELTGAGDGRLLGPLPAGVHVRPVDGPYGDELYLIWTYENERHDYIWPPTFDPRIAMVLVRGLIRMIPGFTPYRDKHDGGVVDGGYYCKTPENRPLVGPLAVNGAYVVGALSGSGLMSSLACGELVSLHLLGEALPPYARWFNPSRYDDPEYVAMLKGWGPLVGQL